MSKTPDVVKAAKLIAAKAAKEEVKLALAEKDFALQNAEFAKFLKRQAEANKRITQMWDEVKSVLIDAGYTDVIENEHFRVSVSKVFGLKVVDLEALPKEFVHTVKVAKVDEIKKHYEMYGELPTGAVDSSYYRLNKKVK